MSNDSSEPLRQLMEKLFQQYQKLDCIVDQLNSGSCESTEAISDQLKLIQQTESELRPLREEFSRQGISLPVRLQTTTDMTIELIKGLMPKLAELEKATLQSAQRLYPQVQQSVRAVQMQDAYRTATAR